MRILAKLIQLLPLNISMINSPLAIVDPALKQKIKEGMDFLHIFANNKIIDEYEILIPMKSVKLRDYQKQGINWMAKLGAFNLNCALCDDMGLGKTIQSLTIVFNESEKIKRQTKRSPPSIVVCPISLTYNWLAEVNKFFVGQKAAVLDGSVAEREAILN